jgi:hypothetical protein
VNGRLHGAGKRSRGILEAHRLLETCGSPAICRASSDRFFD